MDRTEEYRKKRDEEIIRNIRKGIEFYELEIDVRDFLKKKILHKYMPSSEELREAVKREIENAAKHGDVLNAAIRSLVEEVIEEKISSLKQEIKLKVRTAIRTALDDFDY